jgi:hypothetical protein
MAITVNSDSTTLGHIKIQEGAQRLQSIVDETVNSSHQPTRNEIHQEKANFQKQKDNVADMAARATGSNSSSGNTVSAADRQNEADKGAVAARRSAGSTDSSISSPKESKNIDYAAVYKKDLQGQRRALENAPRTPENQAKHKELTDKIAAIDANTSGTASDTGNSASANKSTSSPPTKAADAKTVQAKLKAEIAELENEQAESPTTEREDKLKELKKNKDYVDRFLIDTKNMANTNLSVSV